MVLTFNYFEDETNSALSKGMEIMSLSIPLRMKRSGGPMNRPSVHSDHFQFLWGWNHSILSFTVTDHYETLSIPLRMKLTLQVPQYITSTLGLSIPLRMKPTRMPLTRRVAWSKAFNSFEDETIPLGNVQGYSVFITFNSFEDETFPKRSQKCS